MTKPPNSSSVPSTAGADNNTPSPKIRCTVPVECCPAQRTPAWSVIPVVTGSGTNRDGGAVPNQSIRKLAVGWGACVLIAPSGYPCTQSGGLRTVRPTPNSSASRSEAVKAAVGFIPRDWESREVPRRRATLEDREGRPLQTSLRDAAIGWAYPSVNSTPRLPSRVVPRPKSRSLKCHPGIP